MLSGDHCRVHPQNSLDDAMEAEIPLVAQPQRAAHLDLPAVEEERLEDSISFVGSRGLFLVPTTDSVLWPRRSCGHDEGSEVSG